MNNLNNFYENLISNRYNTFIINPDGQILDFKDYLKLIKEDEIGLFSGSFNPLHFGHIDIYNSIQNNYKLFELSIMRYQKENLSLEDLKERLKYFEWKYPVLITKEVKFSEKTEVLKNSGKCNLSYHVGIDTYTRMLESSGLNEIENIDANFIIHDRLIDGKLITFDSLKLETIPKNCFSSNYKRDLKSLSISSSAIREEFSSNGKQ